jgi:putative chitobiose transport system substrate-binding protein
MNYSPAREPVSPVKELVRRAGRKYLCYLLLLTPLILCKCGEKPQETKPAPGVTEISIFTMQLRPMFDDYFLRLIGEFEKNHPSVKIKWLDYPATNYDTKLMTSFIGENPPDVINLPPQMLMDFAQRNTLAPLEGLVPRDVLDTYFPNVIRDGCMFGDKLYAIPWYLATTVAMINMKIFEEAGLTEKDIPTTNEELWEIAKTIRKKTDKFAIFPGYTEAGAMHGMLYDAGVPILDSTEKHAIFNTPKAVKVFKYWIDFYREGLVPSEALTAMHRRPIELYKSGKLAIFHSGAQFLKLVKSDSPDVYDKTVIRPRLHWKDRESCTIDVQLLSIAQKSRHPKLAAEFAQFVTNGENQLDFCKIVPIIPSVIKAAEDPYFTDVEDTPMGLARKYAAVQVKKGVVVRFPQKHSARLFKIMDDITEKVGLGQMTPEEGIKQAEDKWNEILRE